MVNHLWWLLELHYLACLNKTTTHQLLNSVVASLNIQILIVYGNSRTVVMLFPCHSLLLFLSHHNINSSYVITLNRACLCVSHNALFWESRTHSVNDSSYDFDWVFLEIAVKNCIVGMFLTCPITHYGLRSVKRQTLTNSRKAFTGDGYLSTTPCSAPAGVDTSNIRRHIQIIIYSITERHRTCSLCQLDVTLSSRRYISCNNNNTT